MKIRNVDLVASPTTPHWVGDGFRVYNFIPSAYHLEMERMNPFILLDYNPTYHFSPEKTPLGVGVHPHRGFETVTIAYKGKVEHHDSHGGGGIIGEGDVQWMTAASGVLHKEYHEKEWSRNGGDFQMVQLWVNLPAKNKMGNPKYQAITNKMMRKFFLADDMGEIEVIAGEYQGIKGPAFTFTPMCLLNAKLKKGAKADFSFPMRYNTGLLVVKGAVRINDDEEVPADHFVLMANDGENFSVNATQEAIVLVLSGEPIQEPIVSCGPFVMNTREETVQAYEDFNQGKFGFLGE